MGSVVLKSLSVLLGIFFVFVGTMKLTSHISKDLHKDLRKEYVKYAKVFPLSGTLDFKVPSKWYRRVVGSLEIICGLAMAIIPSRRCKKSTTFFHHNVLPFQCIKEIAVFDEQNWFIAVIICKFLPDKVKNLSNTVLLLLMLMAVYSHYMVNDKFERIAPALVFFFMLTGRLVIDWQLRRGNAQSVTANGVDDRAKKQD
ncbi:Transmembrane protein 35 [Trachymyrmex zeteki]|uniref:Novel acetylcholine receptor chaperone n=1 Tax=Mycetomoellerius zeteki TaxID=64791 RepID=A0A151XGB0_9HYME|nr:Transmembrane protein 35 [Trachymyrmex zeteki]